MWDFPGGRAKRSGILLLHRLVIGIYDTWDSGEVTKLFGIPRMSSS